MSGKKSGTPRHMRGIFTWKAYPWLVVLAIFVCGVTFMIVYAITGSSDMLDPTVLVPAGLNIPVACLVVALTMGIWHRITVEKPLRRVLDAVERIGEGDFSARMDLGRGRFHEPDEFDDLAEGINQMASELGSVEVLRSDFVSSVSHEFKTPVAQIQALSTMLQDEDLSPEERAEYTARIHAATERLSTLVTNVLRVNRLETGRVQLERAEYDLGEQLCECFLGFERQVDEKGLAVTTDLAEGVRVNEDAELLSLVWNNLFSNAVKFSPEGGELRVTLAVEGNEAVVSVADEGPGMSEETQRHIFEKFYQGDTSHASEGNGLGLALARRVADLSGFTLGVRSAPGEGSTFFARLPLAALLRYD